MMRRLGMTVAVGVAVTAFGAPATGLASGKSAAAEPTTHTGWFSDRGCAEPRVKSGTISPNNPDCVKRCLDEGKEAVFVSEQAKALFTVKDYTSVKEDVGWHLELTGTIDAEGKTIAVQSVKRIEYIGAQCALPRKGAPKKTAAKNGAAASVN